MTQRTHLSPLPVPDAVLTLTLPRDAAKSGYATSYPYLVNALQGRSIDAAAYVQAAHMVYGWMPTVLELRAQKPAQPFVLEAALLERARNGDELTAKELTDLARSVNNSIVGASKLLHFVRPDRYAIWDSKVYAYLRSVEQPTWHRKVYHDDVNQFARYEPFMRDLRAFVTRPAFHTVHQQVNDAFGYPVTALRAAEVLMYANAPSPDKKKKN